MSDNQTTPEMQAALDAFHGAKTREEERVAYVRMRALGFPPAYGEDGQTTPTVTRSADLPADLPTTLLDHLRGPDLSVDDDSSLIQIRLLALCSEAAEAIDRLMARVAELERDLEEGAAHEP